MPHHKPEEFALRILEHFGLKTYFSFVAGATMDSSRCAKVDVIRYALENCGITDLSAAVMIGDREYDVIGASQAGLKAIGVLYGYGSREELQKAKRGASGRTGGGHFPAFGIREDAGMKDGKEPRMTVQNCATRILTVFRWLLTVWVFRFCNIGGSETERRGRLFQKGMKKEEGEEA